MLVGFLVDFSGFVVLGFESFRQYKLTFKWIQNTYCIFDALYLTWLLRELCPDRWFKLICNVLLIFFPLFWVFSYIILKSDWTSGSAMSPLFDGTYEMLLTFASAYTLLRMTERRSNEESDKGFLYIVIGIFIINCCTFFIALFVGLADLVASVWSYTAYANLLSYIAYTIGVYYKLPRKWFDHLPSQTEM